MSGHIALQRQGALAFVTLSHPGKFNAMSCAMWRELRAVFLALQADAALRCIVLRGEGGHFCAGGDISEYESFRFSETSLRDFHENEVWGGLRAVLDCDVPVIAQIEGNCMGAGVEIACCCDIRIATDTARFGAPIGRLGFPMAPREAALVLREAGALTAREMLLEGAVLTAQQMQARGFLQRVLPVAQLAAEMNATTQRIVALAPQAARLNKQTLRTLQSGAPDALPALLARAYDYADSAEHREGIAAFLGKRPAEFSLPNS
ncbi:MAG: enoyl-CoA hydratase/isomerase family protein [Hydrogenophaga sp.]|uniref:enoyl-CoA hydratase/isomerase family protein n=1 Tax=Hydrogenophaga sp. TaxID=1904254 RepID=UPI002736CD69|nr:enoyl-CoA hydratase/isomerase family protein [Hydrogenophaga sp.]MDP3628330.1 enoyl-CoA hydratase/isomerase family protein [Hydrogenophaga sp.]